MHFVFDVKHALWGAGNHEGEPNNQGRRPDTVSLPRAAEDQSTPWLRFEKRIVSALRVTRCLTNADECTVSRWQS